MTNTLTSLYYAMLSGTLLTGGYTVSKIPEVINDKAGIGDHRSVERIFGLDLEYNGIGWILPYHNPRNMAVYVNGIRIQRGVDYKVENNILSLTHKSRDKDEAIMIDYDL